jgi:TIR domain
LLMGVFRCLLGSDGTQTERGLLADATIVGMSDAPIHHAFVSYVHEDADAVDQLVSVLQAASIPVWKDTENLWPGEDWQQKIRGAIEDGSLAFIACFSTSSVQKVKTYMNAELILAVEQIRLMKPGHVWLLPVRLDDCELPHFDRRHSGLSGCCFSQGAVFRVGVGGIAGQDAR